jgi:hypothetical protein
MKLTAYEKIKFGSTQQHLVLIDMIRRHKLHTGAEIGVLKGKTISNVLKACPNVFMYAVDQWKEKPFSEEPGAETYLKFNMAACRKLTKTQLAPYPGRWKILDGDSVEMANRVEDGILDFVFIDGDHTYTGVTRDILAWTGKVHSSGWVFGHDWNWEPVQQALADLAIPYVKHDHNVWSVRRSNLEHLV